MLTTILGLLRSIASLFNKWMDALRDQRHIEQGRKEARLEALRHEKWSRKLGDEIDDRPTPSDKSDVLGGM